MAGRSIKIFLPDGPAAGLRTAELGLSTIKAVVAPRTLLSQFALRPEAKRTGVYLLVGANPDGADRPQVYVGEGDEILTRISSHQSDTTKDFFDTAFVFVSKDENLTKAHVRWLEGRIVERLKSANRSTVVNKTEPSGGTLPESDIAEMSEYLEQVNILLIALGLNLFEAVQPSVSDQMQLSATNDIELSYSGEGYSAKCKLREGAFVIQRNSIARTTEASSLANAIKAIRSDLVNAGVLHVSSSGLVFQQDYEFESASRSAQVICAFPVNGWSAWRLGTGETLDDWQSRQYPSAPGAA